MPATLPIDRILAFAAIDPSRGRLLGRSREGREVIGYRIGNGERQVSLVAGCHADEPVGPAMLDRLAAFLAALPVDDPLVASYAWYVVPHINPDGEVRNRRWTEDRVVPHGDRGLDLGLYLRQVKREPPGDDVEFGFPRHPADAGVRPENRAAADFLRAGGPFVLHVSFHGMAFAAGPWFLMERSWAERTAEMRERLRARATALGYQVHDIDRRGEKGFHRIDEGFTSRPDSRAMRAHFEALDDRSTAELFRPSSMEFIRSLGGDPLTLVSEMPLFLLPAEHYREDLVRPAAVVKLRQLAADAQVLAAEAERLGVRAMPVADQMRLQLSFLQEGLTAATARLRRTVLG